MSGTCARDGSPAASSSFICARCTVALLAGLNAAADLLAELDVTLARQARIGDGGRHGRHEQPLPYSVAASEAASALLGALRRAVATAGAGGPVVASTARTSAVWLARHVSALTKREEAPWHVDDVLDAVELARVTIDRPAALWYAGICWSALGEGGQCAADLYGVAGEAIVTCPNCGARHDAQRRRDWLLEQVDDQLANATQLARAVTTLGAEVNAARIWKWAQRGRIVAHSYDARHRPLYRVGDVLDVLREEIAKRSQSA